MVRRLIDLGDGIRDLPPKEGVDQIQRAIDSWTELNADDRILLHFAALLTRCPDRCQVSDLEPLRQVGLDDRKIHDLVQLIAFFAHMNRLADGLGVGLDEDRRELAIELYGLDEWKAHQEWAARA